MQRSVQMPEVGAELGGIVHAHEDAIGFTPQTNPEYAFADGHLIVLHFLVIMFRRGVRPAWLRAAMLRPAKRLRHCCPAQPRSDVCRRAAPRRSRPWSPPTRP